MAEESAVAVAAGRGLAVLCVDDDPNILEGFRRFFRKKFEIYTAAGPEHALEALAKQGPFAVVVSDLQMPGMNGVEFLSKVRAQSPLTVRIMLTGQGDLSTAVAAVNQGSIFRFLVKPCPLPVLEKVIQAALEQHQLIIAERQLTEETLLGCVQVLVEILSLVQPQAFSQAMRIRRYVRHIATEMGVSASWQFEASAMLSQIGWVTLPPDLAIKVALKGALTPAERSAFMAHAEAAAKILDHIPRLDAVAKMIRHQHTPFRDLPASSDGSIDPAVLGAQMLKAALDFDDLRQTGFTHEETIERMRSCPGLYNPQVLHAMGSIRAAESFDEIRLAPLAGLSVNMVLEEDILTKSGVCLLGKGQELTETALQRLRGFTEALPPREWKVRIRKLAA